MKIKSTKGYGSDRLKVLVYGPSGSGKTTLASTLDGEKVLILSSESGLLSISDHDIDYQEVSGFEAADKKRPDSVSLLDAYSFLASGKHDYTAIVIDSMTDMLEMLLEDGKKQYKTRSGEVDVLRAYGAVAERGISAMKKFRDLPMHVVMLFTVDIVDDAGVVTYHPSAPGKGAAKKAPELFDEIFSMRLFSQKDDDGNTVTKHALMCKGDGKYLAKDRSRRLDMYEPAHLGRVFNKIRGGSDG